MTREEVMEILERFVIGSEPCSQREIIDACASAYGMLKKQLFLPSNLDEAAKRAAASNYIMTTPYDAFLQGHYIGAEWMAEQGINSDFEVCKLANRAWLTPIDEKKFMQDIFDSFESGDKVVVQIRKK